MSSKHRTLVIDAAAVACPLILVVAVRTFFAPAPSDASPTKPATSAAAPVIVPVATAAKLSAEQQKAVDWVSTLAPMKGLVSPLDHPVAAPPPRPAHEPESQAPDATPEPIPASDPLGGLKLTGILGNDDGGLAAINGRVYKVGDFVRQGLKLKLIEAKSNTVVFTLDDGTELKLHRKQQ